MPAHEMIAVENINVPGRASNVNAEKYRAMRKALLAVLPKRSPGLTQEEMVHAVVPCLPDALWPGGQKARWWIKTVQLDLEAKSLIRRDKNSKPLRWVRQ
ncbi:MAG: DUF6958 family protein [Planctomycetota bacterium]